MTKQVFYSFALGASRKYSQGYVPMNQLVDLAITKSLPSDRQFYVGEEELIRVFHLSWREAQFLQVLLVYSVGRPGRIP